MTATQLAEKVLTAIYEYEARAHAEHLKLATGGPTDKGRVEAIAAEFEQNAIAYGVAFPQAKEIAEAFAWLRRQGFEPGRNRELALAMRAALVTLNLYSQRQGHGDKPETASG